MDFSDNYDKLKKVMKVNFATHKVYHTISDESVLFPFKIENTFPKYKNGFYNIFGEFSRILLDKKLDENSPLENLTQDIMNNRGILYIQEGNEENFETLLDEFIFDEKGDLKLSHPSLYHYIPLSDNKHKTGEKEVALFIRDIFCFGNDDLVIFFQSKNPNHVLIDLILENTPQLENNVTEKKYFSKLDYINNLFNDDIKFAIENEKFFLDNMDIFFAFYYFFYISQLILKLKKRSDFDDSVEELYYMLDWESRKAPKTGYDLLKDACYATFPRISLISQLNTLFGTKYCLENELIDYFNKLDDESKQNFSCCLKQWILDYRQLRQFEESYSFENPNASYEELVEILYDSLNDDEKGVSYKSKKLFTQNLEEMAKKYFLKLGYQHRFVLNINRDMLLMITALCVKDEKIKLKQLFKEYEKRGIFFDKYSKKEVESFLTKLNLIDKKSDSGDAKYVKPIL